MVVRKHVSGPFVFPVRDIAHRAGEMREFDVEVPAPAKWGEGLVSIAQGEPIDLAVRLESVHEGILVTAEIDTAYSGVCGRCLTDEVQDDHVDLETPVRDAIVLSLPFQPVCQPDCPGLDPVTGEKLAAGTAPEIPIDERWAALKALTPDPDDEAPRPVVTDTEKS